MQFAVLDQNAGSLRGWRVPRSTEANGEVLHFSTTASATSSGMKGHMGGAVRFARYGA